MRPAAKYEVEERARLSGGTSEAAIYQMVRRAVNLRHRGGGVLIDVGCGAGNLWSSVNDLFGRYIGVDAVKYEFFPDHAEFHKADLNNGRIDLADNSADVVTAVETIEHLENPRAFMRELVRLARPGGWVIVTTPNQLSLLSLACLVVKHRFAQFQEVHYPAHLTALLAVDLQRIANECGLEDVKIEYSQNARIIWTSRRYPGALSRIFPRALSDNVLMAASKPFSSSAQASREAKT